VSLRVDIKEIKLLKAIKDRDGRCVIEKRVWLLLYKNIIELCIENRIKWNRDKYSKYRFKFVK